MNKRVTKLLYKYASISEEMDIKDLKKWWNSLNWHEKTRERKRMEEDLGYVEAEETETESEAEEEGYAKVVEESTVESEEKNEEEKEEKKS